MRIEIDPRKSVWENAADYFELAKKLKRKAASAAEEIERTKSELAELRKVIEMKMKEKRNIFVEKPQWFEKFRWFITSDGFLAIGGKSAKQNQALVRKYLGDSDLFFHVEGYPGSVVVLKNGASAPQKSLLETAQFAACYSDAWQAGIAVADSFCVRKEQIALAPPAGQYGKGFVIKGEKKIFKNVKLAVLIGMSGKKIISVPQLVAPERFESCYLLTPGQIAKEKIAKELAKEYGEEEKLMALVPGDCAVEKVKGSVELGREREEEKEREERKERKREGEAK